MKNSKRNFLAMIILAVLLAIPTGIVLAKELGMMTISGPGIDGEITVKGPIDMSKLEEAGFLEGGKVVKQPDGLGEGYLMKLFLNLEEGLQPWLQVTYYPAKTGVSGYLHVVNLMEGSPKSSQGLWYEATPQSEKALRELLVSAGVLLAEQQAAPKDISPASTPQAEKQPVVSAPQPEQAVQASPGQAIGTSRAGIRIDPILVWGLGLSVALLLVLLSIRWLVAQRKVNA